MGGTVGRKTLLSKNSVVIAGVRTKGIAWAGGSINLTSGEDDGIQCLANEAAEQSITISAEGLLKTNLLKDIALDPAASKLLTDLSFSFAIVDESNTTNGTLTGDFLMTAFDEGAPYNEGITFSATFESSGAWTYTPEAA